MAADDFFQRWAKRKTTVTEAEAGMPPAVAPADKPAEADPGPPPAPTMDDVAALTHDSDFAPYMGRDVGPEVQRSAMKKLFADPHFNVMDGLDIYVGDYSQPDPMPPGMLESLLHAQDLLNPMKKFGKGLIALAESLTPEAGKDAPAEAGLTDAPQPASATPLATPTPVTLAPADTPDILPAPQEQSQTAELHRKDPA